MVWTTWMMSHIFWKEPSYGLVGVWGDLICWFTCYCPTRPRPTGKCHARRASISKTLYLQEEIIFYATMMWGPQTLHYPWDKWVSAGVTMPPLNILPLPPTEPTNPPLSDNFNFTMLSRFSDGHELVNHLHSLLLTVVIQMKTSQDSENQK